MRDVQYDMNSNMEIQENAVLGIIGAIGGSAIGAAAIVLLGQIGLVASIAGVVLAICTLGGYEMLAKKLSMKGVVICSVVMVIMTFFAEYLDWAIQLYRELCNYYEDVSFAAVFTNLFGILREFEMTGEFIKGLVILYVFTAIGAVPRIKKLVDSNKAPVSIDELSTPGIRDRADVSSSETMEENSDEEPKAVDVESTETINYKFPKSSDYRKTS